MIRQFLLRDKKRNKRSKKTEWCLRKSVRSKVVSICSGLTPKQQQQQNKILMKRSSMIYIRTHQKRVIHSSFCPWKFFTWNSRNFCDWKNKEYLNLNCVRSAVVLAPWLGVGEKPLSSCCSAFVSKRRQFLTAVVLAMQRVNQRSAEDHLFQRNTSLRYPKQKFPWTFVTSLQPKCLCLGQMF